VSSPLVIFLAGLSLFLVVAVFVLVKREWPKDIVKLAWSRAESLRSTNPGGWLVQRGLLIGAWAALWWPQRG
jgi:hypothetical protein